MSWARRVRSRVPYVWYAELLIGLRSPRLVRRWVNTSGAPVPHQILAQRSSRSAAARAPAWPRPPTRVHVEDGAVVVLFCCVQV
jgi:hypothetical protein